MNNEGVRRIGARFNSACSKEPLRENGNKALARLIWITHFFIYIIHSIVSGGRKSNAPTRLSCVETTHSIVPRTAAHHNYSFFILHYSLFI